MINNTVLVGRLTKDPELRKTQNGISVVSFTLAINRTFNREETDFINCVAWKHSADFMAQYLNKGDLVGITGRIQTRSYDDKNGKKVYITEVVADNVQSLGPRKERENVEYHENTPEIEFSGPVLDIDSDDLPF